MKIKVNSVCICAIALGMMMATSCNKNNVDDTLRFVAGVGIQTMAPIESNDAGLVTTPDSVPGIQILMGNYDSEPKFNRVGSVTRTATLDGAGALALSAPITINTDGSTANFLGFYPAGNPQWADVDDDTDTLKVLFDLKDEEDIIAASRVSKTYSPTDNTVNLAFHHQLARLRLRCVCDDANGALYQGLSEAKIVVPIKAVMNIPASGLITTTGLPNPMAELDTLDFGTCEMSEDGEYSTKDIMILPDLAVAPASVIKNMEIWFKFAGFPDEELKAYSLNNLSLVAGKTTTITVSVSGATPLVISASIEPWNVNETGNSWTVE